MKSHHADTNSIKEKVDPSAVPFAAYCDPRIFDAEREQIFEGPLWHYLCLETELPEKGCFVSTYIGTTPVVVTRAADNQFYAFVNRCAHRGALVVRQRRGKSRGHVCLYHQWGYDERGNLKSVPYRRGLHGVGGFPDDFKLECNGLRKVRLSSLNGIIFGSLAQNTPSLEDFLGSMVVDRLKRIFNRSVKIIGYQRQLVHANWKMIVENVKDTYHGALLHAFNSQFGFFRSTQRGEVSVSGNGIHSIITTYGTANENIGSAFKGVETAKAKLVLEDKSLVSRIKEFDDDIVTSIIAISPSLLIYHIGNSFVIRHVRPKSVNEFEMAWTYFGYADDPPELLDLRLRQMNFGGPGGYVSMEDAVALEATQQAVEGEGGKGSGVVALGGRETSTQDHLVTEVAIRGFWEGYHRLMADHSPFGAKGTAA